jgi:hypothetical protein
MEPWKVCIPVVAESHHFDKEKDPDPQHSEKSDPHQSKRGIRIRIMGA